MADDFSRPAGVGAEPQQHVNLQIQEQCGVGPDAVAYRAVRLTEGDVVEVRILNPSIKEGDRWNALLKRLRLVQLADSPAITRVLATQLDAQPPRLVMEKRGETPLSSTLETLGADHDIARLTIAGQVAAAMTAAHTVGLVHGDFCLRAVRVRPDQTVVIDFSGVDATSGAEAKEARLANSDRAPELRPGTAADMPADVYSLASVLISIIAHTDEPKPTADSVSSRAALFDEALSRIAASNRQAEPATRAVVEIIREALEREPADRPSAQRSLAV